MLSQFNVINMKNNLAVFFLLFLPVFASGQIIPPGLGDVDAGSWMALGLKQNMGKENSGWTSSTYIGAGRKSTPDRKNPFEKHAILVLNQEFYHRFHSRWEYSIAASYRRQDLYKEDAPATHDDPRFKQEMRLYGRMSYLLNISALEITPTFRQEVMKYYTPDFSDFSESMRIRSRFRIKLSFPFDTAKVHRLSLYSEQLFSMSQSGISGDWGPFQYSDSRFAAYYTFSPRQAPFSVNIGYMCNVAERRSDNTGHYVGVDLILKNIF